MVDLKFSYNNTPMENLLVSILIKASYKNDIPLGFFITNSNGTIIMSEGEIWDRIKKQSESYPMDYHLPTLPIQKIEIRVGSEKTLLEKIKGINKFYPEDAKALQELMKKSCNERLKDQSFVREAPFTGTINLH